MKKKITVVDKTFTPIVVLVDASSAIYEDRGQRPGEQNLLSETTITCTAMDGTKKVATMKASTKMSCTRRFTLGSWTTHLSSKFSGKMLDAICEVNRMVLVRQIPFKLTPSRVSYF